MGRKTTGERTEAASKYRQGKTSKPRGNPVQPKASIRPKGNPLKGVYGFKAKIEY